MKIKQHLLTRGLVTLGSLLAAAIVVLGYSQNVSAQWSTSGTNVYYNGGNVGIGTTGPSHLLTVGSGTNTNVNSSFQILASNNSQAGLAAVSSQKAIYLFSDGTLLKLDAYNYNTSAAMNVQIGGNGGNLLLNPSGGGNVGIGTTSPDSNLSVSAATTAVTSIQSTGTIGGTRSILQLINPASSANGWDFGYNLDLSSQNFTVRELTNGATSTRLTIQKTTGNLGIGTPSPGSKLEVAGNIGVTGTGNITAAGTITGGNIVAKYQDVAEWVPSSEQVSAGTVVVLDTTKTNQVISSTVSYDTLVAGVVSDRPGITLGEIGAGKVLVATTGRVLVKVDASRGPIHIGDLLVTSNVPGLAMKSVPISIGGAQIHRPGTLIGKALESLEKGSGKILVLLSLQ